MNFILWNNMQHIIYWFSDSVDSEYGCWWVRHELWGSSPAMSWISWVAKKPVLILLNRQQVRLLIRLVKRSQKTTWTFLNDSRDKTDSCCVKSLLCCSFLGLGDSRTIPLPTLPFSALSSYWHHQKWRKSTHGRNQFSLRNSRKSRRWL